MCRKISDILSNFQIFPGSSGSAPQHPTAFRVRKRSRPCVPPWNPPDHEARAPCWTVLMWEKQDNLIMINRIIWLFIWLSNGIIESYMVINYWNPWPFDDIYLIFDGYPISYHHNLFILIIEPVSDTYPSHPMIRQWETSFATPQVLRARRRVAVARPLEWPWKQARNW